MSVRQWQHAHPSTPAVSPEVEETSKSRLEGFGLQSNRGVVVMYSNHLKSNNLKWYVNMSKKNQIFTVLYLNLKKQITEVGIMINIKLPGSMVFDKPGRWTARNSQATPKGNTSSRPGVLLYIFSGAMIVSKNVPLRSRTPQEDWSIFVAVAFG